MKDDETFISRWMKIYQTDIATIFWNARKSWDDDERQIDNVILPKLIGLAGDDQQSHLALDFLAIAIVVANLSKSNSIAKTTLKRLQTWNSDNQTYRACSTVALLYLGERHDEVDIKSLLQSAEAMKFALSTLPREVSTSFLHQLIPILLIDPDILKLILDASHVTQSFSFHEEASICLGELGIFDDLIYESLYSIWFKGGWMRLMKFPDIEFIEYSFRARKAFIYLVQSNPEAGDKFTEHILDRWESTATQEILLWMSIFLSIEPNKVSSFNVEQVAKLAKVRVSNHRDFYYSFSGVHSLPDLIPPVLQCLCYYANALSVSEKAQQYLYEIIKNAEDYIRLLAIEKLGVVEKPHIQLISEVKAISQEKTEVGKAALKLLDLWAV